VTAILTKKKMQCSRRSTGSEDRKRSSCSERSLLNIALATHKFLREEDKSRPTSVPDFRHLLLVKNDRTQMQRKRKKEI